MVNYLIYTSEVAAPVGKTLIIHPTIEAYIYKFKFAQTTIQELVKIHCIDPALRTRHDFRSDYSTSSSHRLTQCSSLKKKTKLTSHRRIHTTRVLTWPSMCFQPVYHPDLIRPVAQDFYSYDSPLPRSLGSYVREGERAIHFDDIANHHSAFA